MDPENDEDAKKFFDFSFEEIGKFDYPAVITYITEKTKKAKINVIAHSQGTTGFFYGMTQNQDFFKSKVSNFIALAPVAKLDNPPPLLQTFSSSDLVIKTAKSFGIIEMFPKNYLNSKVFSLLCSAVPQICHAPLEQISDKDPTLNDPE